MYHYIPENKSEKAIADDTNKVQGVSVLIMVLIMMCRTSRNHATCTGRKVTLLRNDAVGREISRSHRTMGEGHKSDLARPDRSAPELELMPPYPGVIAGLNPKPNSMKDEIYRC